MFFLFFKQKTAYEMRISDWSSDVCSSDLTAEHHGPAHVDVARDPGGDRAAVGDDDGVVVEELVEFVRYHLRLHRQVGPRAALLHQVAPGAGALSRLGQEIAILVAAARSEERRVGQECVSAVRSRWSPDH